MVDVKFAAPFVAIAARFVKKLEDKDCYDHGVNYNPFLYNNELLEKA